MPKRGENIRKRKDGRWEARIPSENGKYKSIYANSYYAVKDKLKQHEESKQKTGKHSILTFEQICQQWLHENEIKNKQSTIARYRNLCKNHIIPYFKHIKPNSIERNHVNDFIRYETYERKLEPKTTYDILTVLIQIIRFAESQGYIQGFQYDIAMPAVPKKELEILTETEQEKLVNLIKPKVTNENIGILLSLYAGLRLGEICALQWKDIDINAGIISVTKTMQRISATDETSETKTVVIIDTPKSQKSIRKIPIPNFLLPELQTLSKGCCGNDYLLASNKYAYTEPRAYQNKFKKYLKQAGIRDINFHSLRHTFATRAVEQNMDIKTLSEILGHSTVNFTLDRYVHPSFNLKKQSIEKLAACY